MSDCCPCSWVGDSGKFLPIVFVPLAGSGFAFARRRWAAAMVGLLYVPFLNHGRIPDRFALGMYRQTFPFNGPVFATLARGRASAVASWAGSHLRIGNCTWLRSKLPACSPDESAWPIAACLSCAPGVFLWNLSATPIPDLGLDATDHPLDCEHHHHGYVALAPDLGASVGSTSWLGNAVGIRTRGNRCANCDFGRIMPPQNSSEIPKSLI